MQRQDVLFSNEDTRLIHRAFKNGKRSYSPATEKVTLLRLYLCALWTRAWQLQLPTRNGAGAAANLQVERRCSCARCLYIDMHCMHLVRQPVAMPQSCVHLTARDVSGPVRFARVSCPRLRFVCASYRTRSARSVWFLCPSRFGSARVPARSSALHSTLSSQRTSLCFQRTAAGRRPPRRNVAGRRRGRRARHARANC